MPDEAVNYWFDDDCARAFWDQRAARPYQELLRDTLAVADVRPGERWLDLGCGSGQLAASLWRKSEGRLAQIVASDCAAANAEAIAKLAARITPRPGPDQMVFRPADFSRGLAAWTPGTFDGIISGLAISYAESRDPATGRYTDEAYNRLLGELFRVLKPAGRVIFSVNTPEPRFWRVFWRSLSGGFRMAHARRVFFNALKMQSYGHWLKREARKGRFHFLPAEEITARLQRVGFTGIRHQLSYADQAYVFRAEKPAGTLAAAA